VIRTLSRGWSKCWAALEVGARALADTDWAAQTRGRLERDAAQLDGVMATAGADPLGGTTLFRLYEVEDAADWQHRLAQHHIWSRIFPYNPKWLRLGLPKPADWPRVKAALA